MLVVYLVCNILIEYDKYAQMFLLWPRLIICVHYCTTIVLVTKRIKLLVLHILKSYIYKVALIKKNTTVRLRGTFAYKCCLFCIELIKWQPHVMFEQNI